MTKTQFAEYLARNSGMEPRYAEKILNAFLDTLEDALARDGRAPLPGFGVFSVRDVAARAGRNPATGEPLEIPASRTARFRAAAAFKDFLD